MYIPRRKDKKYSEKLFYELCILYLFLISEGDMPLYILNSKIKVSERTLLRYLKEMQDLRLLPPLTKKKTKKEGESPYVHYVKDERTERKKQPSDAKDRLQRCCALMRDNYDSLVPAEESEGKDTVTIGNKPYVFEDFSTPKDLSRDLSVRTMQRDARIVKDAIVYMFEI